MIIEIPPRKLTRVEIKRMAFLAVMGVVSLLVLTGIENLKNLDSHELILYVPAAMLIVSFAVRPVLRQAKNSWRIAVDGQSLTVEDLGPGRKGTVNIPLSELEDLLMGDPAPFGGERKKMPSGKRFLANMIEGPGKKAITANSDKRSVTFGHGVDEKELDYLYQLLRKRISE